MSREIIFSVDSRKFEYIYIQKYFSVKCVRSDVGIYFYGTIQSDCVSFDIT